MDLKIVPKWILTKFLDIMSPSCWHSDGLWTFLSCDQWPIWSKLRDHINWRINKRNVWQGKRQIHRNLKYIAEKLYLYNRWFLWQFQHISASVPESTTAWPGKSFKIFWWCVVHRTFVALILEFGLQGIWVPTQKLKEPWHWIVPTSNKKSNWNTAFHTSNFTIHLYTATSIQIYTKLPISI